MIEEIWKKNVNKQMNQQSKGDKSDIQKQLLQLVIFESKFKFS